MGLRVIAVDTGDDKKKMCLEQLGAESFVDFMSSKNVVKDVQAATEDGLGPHAVILVAVNEKPFQQAAEVCFPSFLTPTHYAAHSYSLRNAKIDYSTFDHVEQSFALVSRLAPTSAHPSSSPSSK